MPSGIGEGLASCSLVTSPSVSASNEGNPSSSTGMLSSVSVRTASKFASFSSSIFSKMLAGSLLYWLEMTSDWSLYHLSPPRKLSASRSFTSSSERSSSGRSGQRGWSSPTRAAHSMSLHTESWLHMSHAIQLPNRSGAAREAQSRAGQGAHTHAATRPFLRVN